MKRRILLANDNYSELEQIHTRLKKIGFDVEGVQNQGQLDKVLLSFNPDVIIASTEEVKIYGFQMTSCVQKKRNGFPKIVLLKYKNKSYSSDSFKDPKVDQVIEMTRNQVDIQAIKTIISTLADFLSLEKNRLLEKYKKIFKKIDEEENKELLRKRKQEEGENTSKSVKMSLSSSLDSQERQDRFQKVIDQNKNFKTEALSTDKIVDYVKEMKANRNEEDLKELDKKRMAFVKTLFNPS